MPHKNIYLQNENLWEEVRKMAFREKKTLSGLIEEILCLYVSEKKQKSLTPEYFSFYIKNNFAKGEFLNERKLVAAACDDVFMTERKIKSIMKSLQLNNVIRPTEEKSEFTGQKIQGYRVV